MKLYRRLGTVPGASIPVSYGILWGADWIKAACVDESRGREVLWTGPERYEVEVAVADAWAHSTKLKRDKTYECFPAGYGIVCHHTPGAELAAAGGDHFQAVFELDGLGPVTATWTGELKNTRPAAIADAWIHASGYEPEAVLH